MRILGLETAGRAVSVALTDGGEILAEARVASSQQHCRQLIPLVDWCLSRTGLDLPGVDGIAVSIGPGSFTGLRIGVATAKFLAMTSGKNLVGIPAFHALVENVTGFNGVVCPVLPSRPGEVYAGFFRYRNGRWEELEPLLALPPGELLQRFPSGPDQVLILGEGAPLVQTAAGPDPGPGVIFAGPVNGRLEAGQVARLGAARLASGDPDDLWRLEPIYYRPPGMLFKGR